MPSEWILENWAVLEPELRRYFVYLKNKYLPDIGDIVNGEEVMHICNSTFGAKEFVVCEHGVALIVHDTVPRAIVGISLKGYIQGWPLTFYRIAFKSPTMEAKYDTINLRFEDMATGFSSGKCTLADETLYAFEQEFKMLGEAFRSRKKSCALSALMLFLLFYIVVYVV